MNTLSRYGWVSCIVLLFPAYMDAACPDDEAVAAFVADFEAVRPSKGFSDDISLADAECARAKVVQELQKVQGRVVGYKAAFTHPDVQKSVGTTGPAWGVMFDKMLLETGATVPAAFGVGPRYEAELIAVVKDAGLSDAKTPLEALQHISEVVAYIELVDIIVEGETTANELIATNIAFRGGVLGPRIKVDPTQAFLDMLANMTVVMTEHKGGRENELSRVKGDVLMGHPINVVMWMAETLKKDGVTLKPGDLLDLGGYLPPAPPEPGTSISLKYIGLTGNPSVTVHFE